MASSAPMLVRTWLASAWALLGGVVLILDALRIQRRIPGQLTSRMIARGLVGCAPGCTACAHAASPTHLTHGTMRFPRSSVGSDGRYWARTSDPQLVELVPAPRRATTHGYERQQPCGFAAQSKRRPRMVTQPRSRTFGPLLGHAVTRSGEKRTGVARLVKGSPECAVVQSPQVGPGNSPRRRVPGPTARLEPVLHAPGVLPEQHPAQLGGAVLERPQDRLPVGHGEGRCPVTASSPLATRFGFYPQCAVSFSNEIFSTPVASKTM
jgi:hypothetical protein